MMHTFFAPPCASAQPAATGRGAEVGPGALPKEEGDAGLASRDEDFRRVAADLSRSADDDPHGVRI